MVIYSLRCPVLLRSKFITADTTVLMGRELCSHDRQRNTCTVRLGWQRRKRRVETLMLTLLHWAANQGKGSRIWGMHWSWCCTHYFIIHFLLCLMGGFGSQSAFSSSGWTGVHMSAQENSLEHELILRPLMHEVICFIIAAERLLMHQRDAAAWEPSGN